MRNTQEPRPSVPVLPDESFTHQPCAVFQSRQVGNRVIGHLHYELQDGQEAKFLDDPTFVCEPRVLFGLRDQIREVRIGNVDWGGREVKLLPGQAVAVSYGDLFFGVVLVMQDTAGAPEKANGLIAYGEDSELRLHMRLYGGPDLQSGDRPMDALIFVEVKIPDADDSLADFAAGLSGWQLTQSPGDADAPFKAAHVDGASIAYPYTDSADKDPVGDALHVSPGLRLCPGDLVALVDGESPLPFV